MPTVAVDKAELFERLGLPDSYTDEQFDDLCFQFGVELDEVLDEKEAAERRQREEAGDAEAPVAPVAGKATGGASTGRGRILYYIAVPANRYDLLCIEGIARGFNVFLSRMPTPTYTAITPASPIRMTVKRETQLIRPYVVCAVLRGVTFTPSRYASFIDLQDKLHHNICRKRTLVAIGTHDLDTLAPPFTYEALAPKAIEFTPLSQAKPYRADALMEFYRTDPSVKHIKPYVDIIAGSPVYPVIYDAKRTVLSLPPIINGEHSKISLSTRNVFIECTGTDLTKAHVVLNTVVAMFSEYAAAPFTAETVEVEYEAPVAGVPPAAPPAATTTTTATSGSGAGGSAGGWQVTPDLSQRPAEARMKTLASVVGVAIPVSDAVSFAARMQLPGEAVTVTDASSSVTGMEVSPGDTLLRVQVPPTRTDVLHECDVIEDVAIAFGFNNIPRTIPKTATTGSQLPINKLTDQLRREIAHAGYDETLTLALVAREDNYANMLLPDPSPPAAAGAAAAASGSSSATTTTATGGAGTAAPAAGTGGGAVITGVGALAAPPVVLANPKTEDFQIGRTHMVPGLLKALASNRGTRFGDGVKLFEISDVMLLDPASDVGARNERRLAALYTGVTAGFEIIHGLLDRVMLLLEVPARPYSWAPQPAKDDVAALYGRWGVRYWLEPDATIPSYFPGRAARVMLEFAPGSARAADAGGAPVCIGSLGVIHPKVLTKFGLGFPVSVVEIAIEHFLTGTA